MKRVKTPGLHYSKAPIYSASPQRVAAFKSRNAQGPTAERFALDFSSFPRSVWNKCATDVFTEAFLESELYNGADERAISTAFRTHTLQLYNQYRAFVKRSSANTDDEADDVENARLARRRCLRHRRADVPKRYMDYPVMEVLRRIWDLIPWEAVSGDETDHRLGNNRYAITSLPWRARWIHQWMVVFDRLHLATRFQSGRATAGAFPRVRVANRYREDQECATPVRGLPRNFYDPDWLLRQDKGFIRWLDIQAEIDLRIPMELLR
ncbi:hypothetical protein BDZ97DRAFT_1654284 [Flammula alnicola]|nr:hypothetical protein BDZ97DRAFT_1654284 [Flammula alnicola]